jgi:hypothetical protein
MTDRKITETGKNDSRPASPSALVWVVIFVLALVAKLLFGGGDHAASIAAADQENKAAKSAEKMRKIMDDNAYANFVVDSYRRR